MIDEVDARAGGMIAGCLAARATGRVLDVLALAWTNSRARQLAVVPRARARFWTMVSITATMVVLIGGWLGVPR